ncbi:dihydropteroate synthase [Melissococcus sp. OM08-11BH]|nr:dihydropteroate synthase [Melissococcus sp. OM08-11BH]
MGILNVTPDSFSDGGDYTDAEIAVEHAKEMIAEGVDIIDIGGQSTRPGYMEIGFDEEMKRVIPVIQAIRTFSDVPISIDTYFPEVAKAAIEAGANIVNDIKGMDMDGMAEVVVSYNVPVIIMHSRPRQEGVSIFDDLAQFYQEKMEQCQSYNIPKENICFDPGIGFHKSMEDNELILSYPEKCRYEDYPLLYGVSRKRTIAHLINEDKPKERDFGTVAASLFSLEKGVEVVRVHNVKGMSDALTVWNKLKR